MWPLLCLPTQGSLPQGRVAGVKFPEAGGQGSYHVGAGPSKYIGSPKADDTEEKPAWERVQAPPAETPGPIPRAGGLV